MFRRFLLWLAALVAVCVLAYAAVQLLSSDDAQGLQDKVDSSTFQAISLETGELYFGKLRDDGGDFVELREAHVLRQTAPAKKGDEPGAEVVPTTVKLHGPEGEMIVSRQHIVFVEDLSDDSAAVRAIRDRGPGQ